MGELKEEHIHHEWTDEIVCPYCGHELSDSFDYGLEPNVTYVHIDCPKCEKEFCCGAEADIKYTTEKMK